jgi:hypothetical protein
VKIRNSEIKIAGAVLSKDADKLLIVVAGGLTDQYTDTVQTVLIADVNNINDIDYTDYNVSDLIKVGIIDANNFTNQLESLKEQVRSRDNQIKVLKDKAEADRLQPILDLHTKLRDTPTSELKREAMKEAVHRHTISFTDTEKPANVNLNMVKTQPDGLLDKASLNSTHVNSTGDDW